MAFMFNKMRRPSIKSLLKVGLFGCMTFVVFKILQCSPEDGPWEIGSSKRLLFQKENETPEDRSLTTNKLQATRNRDQGDYFRTRMPDIPNNNYSSVRDMRLKSYQQVCLNNKRARSSNYRMAHVVFDSGAKLAYCVTPKIGCTFWLRVFSFVTMPDEMKKRGIKTPFDIDRSLLHTGVLGPPFWKRLNDVNEVAKPSTLRFLFVRNPYERLWSVYLDKYYLIDYWVTKPIASTPCGLNVTFQQFLDVALTSADRHLVPVMMACQPCRFKPNFIGKMETFSQDSKHVLKASGYDYLISDHNHSRHIEDTIKSLVVYNFKVMRYEMFASGKCLSPKDICERMWRVFQINGLLKGEIPFPKDGSDYSEKSAINMFLEVVRTNPISREESKQQRKDSITKAYSDIRWNTITNIQNRYRGDFEMFEYDLYPPKNE